VTYRCGACGVRIVVPSWSRWPDVCRSCGTAPPPLALVTSMPTLELVPPALGEVPLGDAARELGGAA
jgi:hypothetical protein